METQINIQTVLTNIQRLPEAKLSEVNDFVEFLLHKIDDKIITEGIQKLSSSSKTFEFLEHEPDLYSVSDLKVDYKKPS